MLIYVAGNIVMLFDVLLIIHESLVYLKWWPKDYLAG
jgi:hypothetical protein